MHLTGDKNNFFYGSQLPARSYVDLYYVPYIKCHDQGDCDETIFLTGTSINPSGAVFVSERDLLPLNKTGAMIDGEWYTTPANPVRFLVASYGKDWGIQRDFVEYYKHPVEGD